MIWFAQLQLLYRCTSPPVGANMLAMNPRAPRGARFPALSLTIIASVLAPACGRLPHFRLSAPALGYTPVDPPGALIRRAHPRPRPNSFRHAPESLAVDVYPHLGPGRSSRFRRPGLLARTAATALVPTGRDARLFDAAVCFHGHSAAHHLAGHRARIRGATGLRSVYPQRITVFLGGVDQPLRLLLPGAADHRGSDLAMALLGDSVGHRLDPVYLAARTLLSAANLPDRPGKPAGVRDVVELRPGGGSHHVLRRAHGRRAASPGRVAGHPPGRRPARPATAGSRHPGGGRCP